MLGLRASGETSTQFFGGLWPEDARIMNGTGSGGTCGNTKAFSGFNFRLRAGTESIQKPRPDANLGLGLSTSSSLSHSTRLSSSPAWRKPPLCSAEADEPRRSSNIIGYFELSTKGLP